MAFLQERSEIERSEAISGRKAGNTREYLIFPVFFMLETVRQTERNQLSLSEFKVISMVISIKTSTIQAMEIKFQENGENLVLLTAEILLPPAMSSCFLRVLLCRKGSPMVEFLTENLLVSLRQLRLFSFGQFRSRFSSDSSGAPNGGVPQNICSAEEIQLAGKLIITADFSWEFRTFSKFRARLAGCVEKTWGDWKNTSVHSSCKKHILLRPLNKVIAFCRKNGLPRIFPWIFLPLTCRLVYIMLAGWELTALPCWELELIQTSCWKCGTDIFLPATKKNYKKMLKLGCIIFIWVVYHFL